MAEYMGARIYASNKNANKQILLSFAFSLVVW